MRIEARESILELGSSWTRIWKEDIKESPAVNRKKYQHRVDRTGA